jgi:hypothetical protein
VSRAGTVANSADARIANLQTKTMSSDPHGPGTRTEIIGPYAIAGSVTYLADIQRWEPRMTISRVDGSARDFVVPCGPECYRKNSDEALMVGWATARQWLDGGRIPWHARSN